jgi:PPOX class probable F420-dependent enzyme
VAARFVSLSPKAMKFLEGVHIGKLGTVMKDGSPHVTPVWYMLDDGKVIVNTTEKRVKYHNMLRDNRVCFLIDDGYRYVLLFGRARIAKERDGKKDIETLAIRYLGESRGRKSARTVYWKQPRASVEIIPERVVVGL